MRRLQHIYMNRITGVASLLFGAILGVTGILAIPLSASALSNAVIYNNIPSPVPGNVPSEAFEATSTSEFGGQVQFAGTARYNPDVTVLMSSWGCQTGGWTTDNCTTTPGATFSEPITLNIYNVNADNSPGSLVTTTTKTFNIPYRPSADNTHCTGPDSGDGYSGNGPNGEWYSTTDKSCYNGYDNEISFDLTGQNVTLPSKAIISVAYNTSDYGAHPYGDATACHATSEGCGYDSLNIGLNGTPTTGTTPLPNEAYENSSWSGAYCGGSTGTFRLDVATTNPVCNWTGYQPAFEVSASYNTPATTGDCKNGGWKNYTDDKGKPFTSQAQCVAFVSASNNKSTVVNVTTVTVTNSNNQIATSGNASSSKNTIGGTATTGNASNSNSTNTNIKINN